MPQLFSASADTGFRAALVGVAVLVMAAFGIAFALPFTPAVTEQGVILEQPVQFSHAHHVGGLGLDCRFCHQGATEGRHAGLPPTHTCMTCHGQIWTNAAMLAPVRESWATGQPLRWRQVHRLPDYVYFDHSVHIANGVGCSTCHGAVQSMQQVRQAAPLTMGWCLSCHRDPAAHLRPPDRIFDMSWMPPPDQHARGEALMRQYRIDPTHLTDCSRCHR